MNILNLALGGLTSALGDSPLAALTGIAGALLSPQAQAGGSASSTPAPLTRDSVISDLPTILSSTNLLAQAASAFAPAASSSASSAATAAEPDLTMPALAPMPAPKAAPAAPTDDHGQSNVVFSDAAADGALIH